MLQAYSAPPFNITSGFTTIQGTAGRPIVDGVFIRAQRRRGKRLSESERRVSIGRFIFSGRVQVEVLCGGIQRDESCERGDTQRKLRSRCLSGQTHRPRSADYCGWRTQVVSVRRARQILESETQTLVVDISDARTAAIVAESGRREHWAD